MASALHSQHAPMHLHEQRIYQSWFRTSRTYSCWFTNVGSAPPNEAVSLFLHNSEHCRVSSGERFFVDCWNSVVKKNFASKQENKKGEDTDSVFFATMCLVYDRS